VSGLNYVRKPDFSPSAVEMYSIDNLAIPPGTEDLILRFPDNIAIADISPVDFSSLSAGNESSAQTVCNSTRDYASSTLKPMALVHISCFTLQATCSSCPWRRRWRYDMGFTGGYFGYKCSSLRYVDDKRDSRPL
jgi:hypothetical protein